MYGLECKFVMGDHGYHTEKRKKAKSTKGKECYAINCNNYQNVESRRAGITFHKFPSKDREPERYEVWVRNCRRDLSPSPYAVVCSCHFEERYIDRTGQIVRLRDGAVPSIFNLPNRLQQALTPRTTTTARRALEQPSTSADIATLATAEGPEQLRRSLEKIMGELSQLKIGFVGAGNMAYGIAQGILQPGDVVASNVIVSAPSKNNFSRFQAMGVTVTHSNKEVVQCSRLVFLAVKPHLIPTVLSALSEHVTPQHIIVSVAAGVTLATLEGLLPGGSCVMRLMPNLPCMLQEGALLLARGTAVKEEVAAYLKNLLSPCGLVEVGPESWIDAHTGLSGSGVAFVYVFAEALAEGAVKMGMPSALAQRLAAQTILGAGRLLRDGEKHPAQLKADVCTPGGTTVYGLHALEKGGLRATVMGAVEAATERARELGRR